MTVADGAMLNQLRAEVAQVVVPRFDAFRRAYDKKDFTQNPNKYLKYSATSLRQVVDELFDQTV